MPGIPRRLAEHSLNILKGFKPVKQALRRFSEPKRQAMGEELVGERSNFKFFPMQTQDHGDA